MSDEAKPRYDPRIAIDPSHALVPAVVKVNEVRVQKGFWPKIRRVASKIPFAKDILAVYFSARDEETPLRSKGLMFAALAYFVLPTDAIPDFIAGLGFTDDAAVLRRQPGVERGVVGGDRARIHLPLTGERRERLGPRP